MVRLIVNMHLFYLAATILASWLIRLFSLEPWLSFHNEIVAKLNVQTDHLDHINIAVFISIISIFSIQLFWKKKKQYGITQ